MEKTISHRCVFFLGEMSGPSSFTLMGPGRHGSYPVVFNHFYQLLLVSPLHKLSVVLDAGLLARSPDNGSGGSEPCSEQVKGRELLPDWLRAHLQPI